MRFVLNIIWLVLAGFWMALGYILAAVICLILIITIPFGFASLQIAVRIVAVWQDSCQTTRRGGRGGLGNVVWLLLFGWWLALAYLLTGVALCPTIIGIPLGLANFKLIPISLLALGREVISIEAARAAGLRSHAEVR